MKVKNIAFSGFAAAILATSAANAAVTGIASKEYVDKVNTKVDTLESNVTKNYTTTEKLGEVINQNISTAINADDGVIKTELAKKEDNKNKVDTIDDTNKDSDVLFPTVGAMTSYTQSYTQKAIEDAVASGIDVNTDQITDGAITEAKLKDGSVTTNKIADKAVTEAKLSDELQTKINGAQSAEQVTTLITNAVTQNTALTGALDAKADKLSGDAIKNGEIAKIDANGNYVAGGVLVDDLAKKSDISTEITSAVTNNTALKTALDSKANVDDVYTKTAADALFNTKIPVPSAACQAQSGRCVLSVVTGSDGKAGVDWIEVTAPTDSSDAGTGTGA